MPSSWSRWRPSSARRTRVASAARCLGPQRLGAAMPFLQPLALTATRRNASKNLLHDLRTSVEAATGQEAAPLERLVRVRPHARDDHHLRRSLLRPAPATGQRRRERRACARRTGLGWECASSCRWRRTCCRPWPCRCVPEPLPLVPNVQAQMASSFVNRVTPANVGGMALNVRFMQKAGVPADRRHRNGAQHRSRRRRPHRVALVLRVRRPQPARRSHFRRAARRSWSSRSCSWSSASSPPHTGAPTCAQPRDRPAREPAADIASLGRSPLRLRSSSEDRPA